METKDLICSINNFEANIVFDKNRSYREFANGQSPFFFTPVEKGERKRYEKSENKNEFTSTTAAIHIMDSSVEEIEKLFKQDDSGIYEYTCKMIRPYCKEERMLFRQYTEEYRNIPKEKEADEFALSYLKETIDKYREVCRNKNSNSTIKRRNLAIGSNC